MYLNIKNRVIFVLWIYHGDCMVVGSNYFRLDISSSWVNMGILNGPRISIDHIRKVRYILHFLFFFKFYSSNDRES